MARLGSSLRRAASPDSVTLGGLKSEITKWRRRSVGDARSVDNVEYSFFHMTRYQQYRQSQRSLEQKKEGDVHFPDDGPFTRRESLQPTHEQSSKTSGRRRERLACAHSSATPRARETERPRHSAAGGNQPCGLQRRHCAGPPLAFIPSSCPRNRSSPTRPRPALPGLRG